MTRSGPSLTAPNSTARCDTDLSPGTRMVPLRPAVAGRKTRRASVAAPSLTALVPHAGSPANGIAESRLEQGRGRLGDVLARR